MRSVDQQIRAKNQDNIYEAAQHLPEMPALLGKIA